jgi:uroporphyrinogen decarboxylase
MPEYARNLDRLVSIVKNRRLDDTMAALIIDSPWLPGYAGVSTTDFYFDPDVWLAAYVRAFHDLPHAAFIPGTWVEMGMAAEPSGWGVAVQWSDQQPPGLHHYPADLETLVTAPVPDPETDGLMPIILRQYERMRPRLAALGMGPRMAACRGPLAIASHLVGVTEILMATQLQADACQQLFDKTTELCIRWLRAQLQRMDEPLGVLVLDDLYGMMGPRDVETFGIGRLKRIFDQFDGLIRIFHNDTPNNKVYPALATAGMDVFNLSHATTLFDARQLVGPDIVLMGNLPPLDLLVRGTPDQVRQATRQQLDRLSEAGPMLVSPGGGVSPGTPVENLQAMSEEIEARFPGDSSS